MKISDCEWHILWITLGAAVAFICLFYFVRSLYYVCTREHVEVTHQKRHACHLCDAVFGYSQSLKSHIETVHEGKSLVCTNNESESVAERPKGVKFDEEVPKINDPKEGQNLPSPNYEIDTEQFKATCHYCDKIYHNEETLKMHLTSHRIELNQ